MIELKLLTKDNIIETQELLEKCHEFLQFQDGEPVGENAAMDLFADLPANVGPESKVDFGIYQDDNLIGVFDLIKAFPNQNCVVLGLMMLEPASRKQGYGLEAYKLLEQWVMDQGFHKIRLGVIIGNEVGYSFWASNGFTETGEIKPYKSKSIKVLEKSV